MLNRLVRDSSSHLAWNRTEHGKKGHDQDRQPRDYLSSESFKCARQISQGK